MSASRRWDGCRVRIVYRDEPAPGSLLRAGLVAVSALLLSNSIRRHVCVELLAWLETGSGLQPVTLRINGARVKWLRADESSLLGVLRNAVRKGSWPGIEVTLGDGLKSVEGCVDAESVIEGECSRCILVKGQRIGLKPWWLLAAAMVAHDGRCWQDCREGGRDRD